MHSSSKNSPPPATFIIQARRNRDFFSLSFPPKVAIGPTAPNFHSSDPLPLILWVLAIMQRSGAVTCAPAYRHIPLITLGSRSRRRHTAKSRLLLFSPLNPSAVRDATRRAPAAAFLRTQTRQCRLLCMNPCRTTFFFYPQMLSARQYWPTRRASRET